MHIGLVFLSGPLAYMLFSIVVGPLSDKLVRMGDIPTIPCLHGMHVCNIDSVFVLELEVPVLIWTESSIFRLVAYYVF